MRAWTVRATMTAAAAALLLCGCSDRATTSTDGAAGGDGQASRDGATGSDAVSSDALGPSTGVLSCGTYKMPPFSKACSTTADCVAVIHTVDCCGTGMAIGLNSKDQAAFSAEEAKCSATYPACGCASGLTRTEDGSKARQAAPLGVGASCEAGICTSYVAACGKVCPGASSCQSCSLGPGKVYAICSTTCQTDAECTDPALPSCVISSYGGKFCAAAADACSP